MNTREALRAVTTGELKGRPKTIWDYLEDPRVKNGLAAVAGKYVTADRMLKIITNAIRRTPDLLKCDPQSLLGGCMATTALQLEPNTVQQLAFLIPYKRRVKIGNEWQTIYECQYQVGARGFITLGYRSPHIKLMKSEAIHDGDLWQQMEGTESFLRYSKALKARGDLIGSFSYVQLSSGAELACVLPLEEIEKIRSKSETWRALMRNVQQAENDKDRARAEEKLAETPWVMWIDDMAAKSATKKHAKQLPIAASDALVVAADVDNRAETSTLDLKAMSDPDMVRSMLHDGTEAPALEHDPGEHLEQQADMQRERVQVPVSEAGAAAAHNRIDPADLPEAGSDQGTRGEPARGTESQSTQQARQRGQRAAGKANEERVGPTYAQLAERLQKAKDRDIADLVLDEARSLPDDQRQDLERLYADKYPE